MTMAVMMASELASQLGVSEAALHELANAKKLLFRVSSLEGFHIDRRD
jgi:hypothetical protein